MQPPASDAGAPAGGDAGAQAPTWTRGSLAPVYQLTPRAEYGRIAQNGTAMQDSDFTTPNVAASAAQKMDEIGAAFTPPIQIIADPTDRDRAQQIPFRGNPSDVKVVALADGTKKVYVPLGGDVMTPGNEIAVVAQDAFAGRITVGLRPQRLAVHPSGLVFVCNQYSNYVSIIDPVSDQPLMKNGAPVEIQTEYFCADLLLVPKTPRSPDPDRQWLYVANRWRRSVLKYSADVVRDPVTNRPNDVIQSLAAEIKGAGLNPFRLAASEQLDSIYVANNKGGEVARIDVPSDQVTSKISVNAPSADVVNIADLVLVPTTMIDRGLLSTDDQHPPQVLAAPASVNGLDQRPHIVHPGAQFDRTRSYNFEDVRNGLLQLDFLLAQPGQGIYYTDDVSGEPNFVAAQKVLSGALPSAIVRNAAGTAIFVAHGGSGLVQQLNVNLASRPFAITAARNFSTGARPFGLALDEAQNRLYVANWGQDTLDVFDLAAGTRVTSVDLGYASPTYPATNVERGEFFFYDARWSNNGRKACATCHFDELDTDGVGFSNGASAPTVLHQVKPNHNLATTDSYFWNGSFADGNYTSLAFGAQTRTNCELIEFGLIEGPGSDPNIRIGDTANTFTNGQDASCRPQSAGLSTLSNQAQIDQVVQAERQIAAQQILMTTGFDRETLARLIDLYAVSELRIPPNPTRQMYIRMQLPAAEVSKIQAGRQIFSMSCAACHDPANGRHPYTDGLNHGSSADWTRRFVDTYRTDPVIVSSIGTFPQTMLDAMAPSVSDHEVDVVLDPVDYFVPLCFDVGNCLEFDDPLAVRGSRDEEVRRLNLLIKFNLGDPDRGFVPGNVRGAPQTNTPSLRAVWSQANLLRMGNAGSIREAVLAPGHPGLQAGENGYAIDALGSFDVHGTTSMLTIEQVDALVAFVESIE